MKRPALLPATAGDVTSLEHLLAAAFAGYARALGKERPGPYEWLDEAITEKRVSLVKDEGVLGAVLITAAENAEKATVIDMIAVHPDRTGQGLGSWLLDKVEDRACSRGHTRVRLHTAAMMTDLVAYYSRRGYRIVRTGLPSHRCDTHLRVFFEKELP
jgi:GNAT superfamily N-acetyltransferase